MIEVKVYKPIANREEGIYLASKGVKDAVFSAETITEMFSKNKNEKDFKFNLHCPGGSVGEGLAEYDILRTSGKNLFTNIEGGCHSMAIILLLSAPFENRTANPNARALIHEVQGPSSGLNADGLRVLADTMEREQNIILDIYADRTGTDRTVLENLMKEERELTAQELLQYGFISKINTYSTNFKTKLPMAKNQKPVELLNRVGDFLKGLTNILDGEVVNYDWTDADGAVLFSTEKEDDSIAVGDPATPDGTYELPDERTVVIQDGVVASISDPQPDATEVENLSAQVEVLTNSLKQARELIVNLNSQVTSNYTVNTRSKVVGKQDAKTALTADELRNEARDKREKMKGAK